MNDNFRTKNRVTLEDVARHVGVSKMTVSKVLRGTGSISEETCKKVNQAVIELGYLPNRLAGSLSSSSSEVVGVVIPSINDVSFGELVNGINSTLRPRGLLTFIGESQFNPDTEEEVIKGLLSMQPRGLIVNGGIARKPSCLLYTSDAADE